MSDILRPEGQHTREILSALINFIKFQQEQQPIFDEIQYQRQREEDIPRASAMKERNDAHRRQLRQLHKTQTNTAKETAGLKHKKKFTERLDNVR
ncbi:hypothetical protein CALCODRAFT_479000 [Calocera cornea HHB12733]|uniref:Kinetochore protein Nuf2 N-terminal domain-containing protein n=1 Tax=Calocera cornea HHB12733 TaxID=1353952 RepID=A0A165K5G1_9BASI|nr:hypothetical protein CALCODRAFT_479000 [Calocera cornea HHB12733]